MQEVISRLRPRFPEAKWLAPGLSPQDRPEKPEWNTQLWLNAWKSIGVDRFVDGFCAHAYWQTMKEPPEPPLGHDDMRAETGGLAWLAVKRTFPGKPVYVSEFSNNSPGVDFREKGRQYRAYREVLKQHGAAAAFGFVLKWSPRISDSPDNHESWVNDRPVAGSLGVAEGMLSTA